MVCFGKFVGSFVLLLGLALVPLCGVAQSNGYLGQRVSINVQNGDVRTLLRLLAEEIGLTAGFSTTVVGTITLQLEDMPADHAIVLEQKGLGDGHSSLSPKPSGKTGRDERGLDALPCPDE